MFSFLYFRFRFVNCHQHRPESDVSDSITVPHCWIFLMATSGSGNCPLSKFRSYLPNVSRRQVHPYQETALICGFSSFIFRFLWVKNRGGRRTQLCFCVLFLFEVWFYSCTLFYNFQKLVHIARRWWVTCSLLSNSADLTEGCVFTAWSYHNPTVQPYASSTTEPSQLGFVINCCLEFSMESW
jgi:hypothetical protein